MIGYKEVSYGYRVPSGFTPGGTAAEVIAHEEEELGNRLGVLSRIKAELAATPACHLMWVCLNREDALRYGPDPELVRFEDAVVVGHDMDGGVLVWIRDESAPMVDPGHLELNMILSALKRTLAMTGWERVVLEVNRAAPVQVRVLSRDNCPCLEEANGNIDTALLAVAAGSI